MNTNTWKMAGLAMAVIGSVSFAQEEQGQGKGSKDKDGRQGQCPSKEQILEKFDIDGDGQLSEDERATMREAGGKKRGGKQGQRPSKEEVFEKFDTDGDGELGEEERAAAREERGDRGGRRPRNKEKMGLPPNQWVHVRFSLCLKV